MQHEKAIDYLKQIHLNHIYNWINLNVGKDGFIYNLEDVPH